MGGIYEFSEAVDTSSIFTYTYALRQCIDRHPQLSTIVAEPESNSSYYAFCPRLELNQHVQFHEGGVENEAKAIERVLSSTIDTKWPSSIPAWKIVILPFSQTRCFIGLSFSHALGDGVSGLAFHRTFLNALQEQRLENDLICTPTMKQLPPAFDTAENLPISWSFLLSPLLGAYLPERIASLLGLRASTSSVTSGTWTGSSTSYSSEICRTGVEILSIDATTVVRALKYCRMHDAKMTGHIHQLIITALSESLPRPNNIDNFGSVTAMDMRKVVGISKDQMGLFVAGDFQTHELQKHSSEMNEGSSWALAKSITARLAARSNTLSDQPIGLLRYLSDMRSWILSKHGQRRDCSYEVSNLVSFQPSDPVGQCSVTEMVFCQPTDVTGSPMSFNIVSVAHGPMTITVSWQFGALGVGSQNDEMEFVRTVCQKIGQSFQSLA